MQLLTRSEAAEFLGISPTTLAGWAWRRKGPTFVKVGRLVRYRMDDLTAYLEANASGGERVRSQAQRGDRIEQELSGRKPTTIRPGTKLHAIAAALCRGERLDCFSAVRRYHDFVLRSTISELANCYGVEIIRTPKTVPGYAGSSVDCVEYRASEDGAKRLARLLGLAACRPQS